MKKYWILILAMFLVLTGVILELTFGGMFSYGDSAFGFFAAGQYSAGVFSIGTFSIGIFSLGIFSIGIFSLGYIIFIRPFAELHIRFSFLDFPVFFCDGRKASFHEIFS